MHIIFIYSLDKISQLSSSMSETLKTINYNYNNEITILKICTKTNWKKHEYCLHFDLMGHNNNTNISRWWWSVHVAQTKCKRPFIVVLQITALRFQPAHRA